MIAKLLAGIENGVNLLIFWGLPFILGFVWVCMFFLVALPEAFLLIINNNEENGIEILYFRENLHSTLPTVVAIDLALLWSSVVPNLRKKIVTFRSTKIIFFVTVFILFIVGSLSTVVMRIENEEYIVAIVFLSLISICLIKMISFMRWTELEKINCNN